MIVLEAGERLHVDMQDDGSAMFATNEQLTRLIVRPATAQERAATAIEEAIEEFDVSNGVIGNA